MAGIPAPRTIVAPPTAEAPRGEAPLWEPSGIIITLILAGVVVLGLIGIGSGMLIMIAQTVLGTAR